MMSSMVPGAVKSSSDDFVGLTKRLSQGWWYWTKMLSKRSQSFRGVKYPSQPLVMGWLRGTCELLQNGGQQAYKWCERRIPKIFEGDIPPLLTLKQDGVRAYPQI